MGAATKTRTRNSEPRRGPTSHDEVSAVLQTGETLSLAELRVHLRVGSGGMSESQLTRTLRQLIDSGQVSRPRRGYYETAPAVAGPTATPAAKPERAPRRSATLVPSQRTPDQSESLARPLRAAPLRPKRARSAAEAPSVAEIPEAQPKLDSDTSDVAVPVDAVPAVPVPGDSAVVDPPSVVLAQVEEPSAAELSEQADTAANDVATEHVAAQPVATQQPAEPELSRDGMHDVSSSDASDDVARYERVLAEVRSRSVVALSDEVAGRMAAAAAAEVAVNAERAWIRHAALPVLWFAVTGLALMFGGVIVGGIVGLVLGAAAAWLYRGERTRQQGLVGARTDDEVRQRAREDTETLDALGVH